MKQKIDRAFLLCWSKRLIVYLIGLYCMAIGVVFSAKSSLGVSPVGSLANVLYQIALARGITFVTLGNATTAVYCLYIFVEFLILRKEFKPGMLLQLVASVLFGQMVNLATAMMSFLPAPQTYPMKMLSLLCSIPMVAVGVMLYLSPNILPTPGEGMSLAISKKTGLSVGSSKTIFDCSLVVISAAVSLAYFHGLVGVREGTVICALFVGFVMKRMQRVCQKPLLKFVERETKIARAIEEALGDYRMDAAGKPKIIITIGREFGAGGYEIGQKLAEKLGITFYDKQLNEMAAEQSGLSLEYIESMEKHMDHEIIYDFKTANASFSNEGMTDEDRLFIAQSAVIRKIAAGDESCVIMGRCADYTLYNDKNCFRIFIHALPAARITRVMSTYNLSEEDAVQQMRSTDLSRSRHYKRYTGRDYGKQEYYHLGLDSSQLGVDGAVELITESMRLWCDVRGTYPLSGLKPTDSMNEHNVLLS